MSIRKISFSTEYLPSFIVEKENGYYVEKRSVIVNLSERTLYIDQNGISQYEATIIEKSVIDIEKAMLLNIPWDCDYGIFSKREKITNNWKHVYDVFTIDSLRDVKLWRSEKEIIGSVEVNLWFAAENTCCGIHNEHSFRELHTQIFGIGHMQKFKECEIDTMYQDVLMAPGFTHNPFYDSENKYPWHQYKADTDCIWLAIEF
ncbi:MAG: hypothetical protein D3911_07205 [Candidatus Electrothrix sp. AW3_4]|nr:hypothetical protein [Candidatus Electrothrix gigas]